MIGKIPRALVPEGRLEKGGRGLGQLDALAALGVVVASVSTAIAVLGGAVYDEHGSHDDAVYRQQLVTEQQVERRREEDIAADEALFGGYEQHVLRARELQRNAAAVPVSRRLWETLRSKAENQRAIATALLLRFHVPPWEATNGSDLFYDPRAAYRVRSHDTLALEEALEPGEHRLDARNARQAGISMTWLAVLFLTAGVFFTTAQVYARIKTPKKQAQAPELEAKVPESKARVPTPVLFRAYALLGAGTALWLVAAFLGLHTAL